MNWILTTIHSSIYTRCSIQSEWWNFIGQLIQISCNKVIGRIELYEVYGAGSFVIQSNFTLPWLEFNWKSVFLQKKKLRYLVFAHKINIVDSNWLLVWQTQGPWISKTCKIFVKYAKSPQQKSNFNNKYYFINRFD